MIFSRLSTENSVDRKGGRVAVIGDSSCFDDSWNGLACLWLVEDLLRFTSLGELSGPILRGSIKLSQPLSLDDSPLPGRVEGADFESVSRVLNSDVETCAVMDFQVDINPDPIEIIWQVRRIFFD